MAAQCTPQVREQKKGWKGEEGALSTVEKEGVGGDSKGYTAWEKVLPTVISKVLRTQPAKPAS